MCTAQLYHDNHQPQRPRSLLHRMIAHIISGVGEALSCYSYVYIRNMGPQYG